MQLDSQKQNNASSLSDDIRNALQEKYDELCNSGAIPSIDELNNQYTTFREKFGPQALSNLDGEQLLAFMHDNTDKDSLVYWLEYKSDEEFRTRNFGGIAGGSALKFGVFRRKETGRWQTGKDKGNKPQDITIEEAVVIARKHREQLIAGTRLLDKFPENASDEDYSELQARMDEEAPDVSNLAWGHKYFYLLYPDKLDDYHSTDLQRFFLLKLLQLPPTAEGRYICAGRFVSIALETNMPMNHLTSVLNNLYPKSHKYWRFNTTDPRSLSYMLENGCVELDWLKDNDLTWVEKRINDKEKLIKLLEDESNEPAKEIRRKSTELMNFAAGFEEGDIILLSDKSQILAIGQLIGEYEYHKDEFPHRRQVQWEQKSNWQLPEPAEGQTRNIKSLKNLRNLFEIETKLSITKVLSGDLNSGFTDSLPEKLTGITARAQKILNRKGQMIFYGPPGTGKTWWAIRSARDIAALSVYKRKYENLTDQEKQKIDGDSNSAGLVRLCCFHPSYGYEDFIEGYIPDNKTQAKGLAFNLRDGIFKSICSDAEKQKDKKFFLIIDEINRGDVSRIFGELLTVLEKDKRQKSIVLPVSREIFSVPENVFVIGTMNTADRSISLLDAALRRRFGFIELMPDSNLLKDTEIAEGLPLKEWFEELNERIRKHAGRDARNLQIGHSYFMHDGKPIKTRDTATFKRILQNDVIPLLEEYCYEDFDILKEIIGKQFVDKDNQQIKHSCFEEDTGFIESLNEAFENINKTAGALKTSVATDDETDDETV